MMKLLLLKLSLSFTASTIHLFFTFSIPECEGKEERR
jgi:hypothetical protein